MNNSNQNYLIKLPQNIQVHVYISAFTEKRQGV
jgi:hypothetical protein